MNICQCIWKLIVFLSLYSENIFCMKNLRVKRGSALPIEITKEEQDRIVNKHNELRKSSGSSDMRFMSWDRELASIAQSYAEKCQYKHNTEAVHSVYKSVGENIYAGYGRKFNSIRAIMLWFNEISDYDFDTRTCTEGKKCGHYTQIVWANSYKIGCGLVVCDTLPPKDWTDATMFICNYSPAGNIIKTTGERYPAFIKGGACTKCSQGDYCRDGLCANTRRDKTDQFSDLVTEGYGGLVAIIIILSILVLMFGLYIIYRERHRIAVRIAFMQKKDFAGSRFSNQSTPAQSRINTPRQSLTSGHLHGTNNIILNDIKHQRIEVVILT